ncbi:MAG: hypothetical protein H6838_14310 [Planctomycetes bacterium]|nr:hypothetical protein [Planctomycetota bacterium]MCB9886663.1 hypothetical protein [Planctomycetota bacterium]
MQRPPFPPDVRLSLRRLSAPHALCFGNTLLERGNNGSISFGEFVDVARHWVAELPDQSALYLAALVALDMSDNLTDDDPFGPSGPPQPSRN